jgi:hypothetical protein
MRIGSTFAATLLLVSLAFGPVFALDTIHGTWTIEVGHGPEGVALTLETGSDARFHDTSSFDIHPNELGLEVALAKATPSEVSFSLVREAGSIAGTGTVARGTGNGTFVFTPSDTYRSHMRDRGYGDLDLRKQFAAATLDLTTEFVDRVAAAGYPHLPFDKLIAFRALGIDDTFIHDMHATFAKRDIDPEEMTSLRALNVTGGYVSHMRGSGFGVDTPNDAVQLRALNVDEDYVRDLASHGYDHLSAAQLVQLRALGIDGAYIKRVEAHGFSHLPIDKLIQLKALNVVSFRLEGIAA